MALLLSNKVLERVAVTTKIKKLKFRVVEKSKIKLTL
jgi:hypothetical protein